MPENFEMNKREDLERDKKQAWIKSSQISDTQNHSCENSIHIWGAHFQQSGRLAYWKCESCGREEKQIDIVPEALEKFSGWIEEPLRLIAIGSDPPKSERKWSTGRQTVLVEKEPSTIHYLGLQIPGLTTAHTYFEYSQKGGIHEIYQPEKRLIRLNDDHYIIIRYQVVENKLIRYESHCFEDSMFEIPNTSEPTESVVLSGLKLLNRK